MLFLLLRTSPYSKAIAFISFRHGHHEAKLAAHIGLGFPE